MNGDTIQAVIGSVIMKVKDRSFTCSVKDNSFPCSEKGIFISFKKLEKKVSIYYVM